VHPVPSAAEIVSEPAAERWDSVVEGLDRCLVCLDFDGTLSRIVDDPSDARIHPDGPEVLAALGARVMGIAIVTGRPARDVIVLGGLELLATRLERSGGWVLVRGQYGAERWDGESGEVESPEADPALDELRDRLPDLLDEAETPDARVEDKGLAVAVHTRRLPDADPAADRLAEALAPVAAELDLALEPGRMVVEVRAPGMDKGAVVRELVEEHRPSAVVFVGDDLGDLPGFAAVEELRSGGIPGLLVCSGSEEQRALVEHSDLVVDGPDGVMTLLRALADAPGS
jgi:trehalose 6-phosphate phosphatase